MQVNDVLAAVVVAGAVVALIALVLAHRRMKSDAATMQARLQQAEVSIAALRDEKSGVERDLAVEQQKASRVRTLESEVAALNAKLETAMQEKADLGRKLGEEAALVAHTTQENARLRADLTAKTNESDERATKLATLSESFEQEKRQAGEKLLLLQNARDQMTKEFKLLANTVMTQHGEAFAKQNKEQIDLTLTPLKEKIAEFQQGLQTAHVESAKARERLAQQIKTLSDDSAKIRSEAESLATALRGSVQAQGAWGEMILDSILERSGLVAGEQYVLQQSHATEDGGRLRTDAIVNLPNGQRIIIDSKVSLSAFDAYVNATTDEERALHLRRHVAAMRAQINLLAAKEYHAVAEGSPDYVVMFVPIEGALAAALQADAEITSAALASNVCIATPTTLMIALRTAANVWHVERRNRNAEAIADRAGRLYNKVADFVGDMTALGTRLDQARTAYDGAMNRLARGNGNVLRQIEQIKTLGAKTGRSLPASLLDSEAEDAPPAQG